MTFLILGLLVCLGLAAVVVALVAIPARREGRELLTPRGEEVVSTVRNKTGRAVGAARSRSGGSKDTDDRDSSASPDTGSDRADDTEAEDAKGTEDTVDDSDRQVGRAG